MQDPQKVFCPNLDCPARGHTGAGNIGLHSRQEKRYICRECRKTFAQTKGTAFYRLRTAADLVSIVVTLLAHGCPMQAIVAAYGLDERTVSDWQARAGTQGQAVQEHLVEQPRELGQVQADELRVKKQGGIVWMALAIMVSTRLWLGGVVRPPRDRALNQHRLHRAAQWHVPLVPDGVGPPRPGPGAASRDAASGHVFELHVIVRH